MFQIFPFLLAALVQCSDEPPKVVYGADNRQDVCSSSSELFKGIARNSIVALIRSSQLEIARSGDDFDFSVFADLQNSQNLCGTERFLHQPAVAFCSGTLVAPDRILTAGHCITSLEDCRTTRFVFDYMLDGQDCTFGPVSTKDVYSCARFQCRLEDTFNGNFDHCLVHLDRVVEGRTPVQVQVPNVPVEVGDSITVIGSGSGIPMKIDSGGHVLSPRATDMDIFTLDSDTFAGNSGSGAFDSTGQLVGILVRGNTDYVLTASGCNIVNRVTCADPIFSNVGGGEQLSYPTVVHTSVDCTSTVDCAGSGETCFRFCSANSTECTGFCASESVDSGASALSSSLLLVLVLATAILDSI